MPNTCSIKNCNHKHKAKGLCVRHYYKEYYISKKDHIAKTQREWRKRTGYKNRPCESSRKWAMENKEYFRRYKKCKRRNDINCRIAHNLRSRISCAMRGKAGSAVVDLGCSMNYFKEHLQKQFLPGMSWDNYGKDGWHIDHIRPLSSFNLTNKKEFKKACHYSNLQPLWANDNLKKSAKYG